MGRLITTDLTATRRPLSTVAMETILQHVRIRLGRTRFEISRRRPSFAAEPQTRKACPEVLRQYAVEQRIDHGVHKRDQERPDEVMRSEEEPDILRRSTSVDVDQEDENGDRQPHDQHNDDVQQ